MSILFSSASKDPFADVPSSPDRSPVKETSPASRLQGVIDEVDFEYSLPATEKAVVATALKNFTKYGDSPKDSTRADKVRATVEAVRAKFPPDNVAFHRQASQAFKEGSWIAALVRDLRDMPLQYSDGPSLDEVMPANVVHLKHIVEGEERAGLHFLVDDSKVKNLKVQPNGVRCGIVTYANGATRFSTLFPAYIKTEAELLAVLNSGVKVATDGNFSLFHYTPERGPRFYFEIISRNGVIVSAYPISHYDRNDISAQLDLWQRIIKNPELVRVKYECEGRMLIVDVAKLFPEWGVEQGCYLDIRGEDAVVQLKAAMQGWLKIKGFATDSFGKRCLYTEPQLVRYELGKGVGKSLSCQQLWNRIAQDPKKVKLVQMEEDHIVIDIAPLFPEFKTGQFCLHISDENVIEAFLGLVRGELSIHGIKKMGPTYRFVVSEVRAAPPPPPLQPGKVNRMGETIRGITPDTIWKRVGQKPAAVLIHDMLKGQIDVGPLFPEFGPGVKMVVQMDYKADIVIIQDAAAGKVQITGLDGIRTKEGMTWRVAHKR